MLAFDPKLLKAFQAAAPGTKAFETRLIELVAVSIHQLGALLYQLDFRLHQGDIEAILRWVPPPSPEDEDDSPYIIDPLVPPTIFYQAEYLAADVYPEGAADVVGYWTEERILGGVVVFDRRAEEADPSNPPNVYLHSNRHRVTK
jgi:hypothetical protein